MTVKDIIRDFKKQDSDIVEVEVYRYKGKVHRLHGDFLEDVDDYDDIDVGDVDVSIMDEEYYNETILANGCIEADFNDWYGNPNAKILVIIVRD